MGMKWIWKQMKKVYGFTNGIDAPVIIRYCDKHQRFEWYDPCNKWGGIAYSIISLKQSLKRLFRCGTCGSYHVFDVAILHDTYIQFLSFIDFISK